MLCLWFFICCLEGKMDKEISERVIERELNKLLENKENLYLKV